MCIFSHRFFSVLFFCAGLVPEAYCIQVRGFNISQIKEPHTDPRFRQPAEGSGNNCIDKMLEGYDFLTSSINPKVEIAFSGEASSTQGSDSELANTDLESISDGENENNRTTGIDPFVYFSLNSTPDEKHRSWNHLEKDEMLEGDPQASFSENLCNKLAKGAFRIANAHEHARTRESTTCLCVVLRDEKGCAKKFVFHNGSEAMHKSMNEKAVALNYAARSGYQAHAEAEFIEFLLHRRMQNKERYTHILGMGCSRQHCKECDCLLQLFLGSNYHEFTAAMQKEAALEPSTSTPAIEELSQDEGDGVRMTVPEESQVFKVVRKEKAIQNKTYPKYRLSEHMQREIRAKACLPDLDFSSERFRIGDMVMARSERRRQRAP